MTTDNESYQFAPTKDGDSYTEAKLKKLRLPEDLRGKDFLDLGCNTGFYCRWAKQHHAQRVVGLDIDYRAIESAKALSENSIEFINSSWDSFPSGRFDVVILLSAIHYAKAPLQVAKNIHASLKPHGLFVLEGGIIFVGEESNTDIPLPGWREVGDRCLHLTHDFIGNHLLSGFEWKLIGESQMRGGDDVQRYVIHATPSTPFSSGMSFRLDIVDFFRAAKLSSSTITPNHDSYDYVSTLSNTERITTDVVDNILSQPAYFEAFVDDLAFCISPLGAASVSIRNNVNLDILRKLIDSQKITGLNISS